MTSSRTPATPPSRHTWTMRSPRSGRKPSRPSRPSRRLPWCTGRACSKPGVSSTPGPVSRLWHSSRNSTPAPENERAGRVVRRLCPVTQRLVLELLQRVAIEDLEHSVAVGRDHSGAARIPGHLVGGDRNDAVIAQLLDVEVAVESAGVLIGERRSGSAEGDDGGQCESGNLGDGHFRCPFRLLWTTQKCALQPSPLWLF